MGELTRVLGGGYDLTHEDRRARRDHDACVVRGMTMHVSPIFAVDRLVLEYSEVTLCDLHAAVFELSWFVWKHSPVPGGYNGFCSAQKVWADYA
jgi:hypothetical protein